MDCLIEWSIDPLIHRWIDWLIDWLVDWVFDRLIGRLIDWLIEKYDFFSLIDLCLILDLFQGFSDTMREIVDAVSEEREQKGMTGAVGGALRQIPPVIVKPLILASQATSNVLGGLINQLQPEHRQDELEKWRTEDDIRGHVNTHR